MGIIKTATENAFVLQYKMSPVFTPYIEYDYLDKQGVYKGKIINMKIVTVSVF